MDIRKITSDFSVGAQITTDDLPVISATRLQKRDLQPP